MKCTTSLSSLGKFGLVNCTFVLTSMLQTGSIKCQRGSDSDVGLIHSWIVEWQRRKE